MGPGLLPTVGGGPSSVQSRHASVYSLHTLIERVEGDLNTSAKDVLARVSRGSESLDEEDTEPLPPLSFPTSPLPVPSPAPTSAPLSASTPTPICAPPPRPPRHYKDISVSSQNTFRPSPPHSASSSPGQTFIRPQLHKKSESVAVMPMRSPSAPDGGRMLDSKGIGRVAVYHHPSSSTGTGAAPPGWI